MQDGVVELGVEPPEDFLGEGSEGNEEEEGVPLEGVVLELDDLEEAVENAIGRN